MCSFRNRQKARTAKPLLVSALLIISANQYAIASNDSTLPARERQERVLVQLRIDTAYSDSEESIKTISQLVDFLPPRTAQLNSHETISHVVRREYGFGNSNLPKLYKLIEAEILRLNHISSPESVQPGPLLIPGLPRRALTDPGPNIYNNLPAEVEIRVPPEVEVVARQLSTASGLGHRLMAEDLIGWIGPRKILSDIQYSYSAKKRPATQEVLLDVWTQESNLQTLLERPIADTPLVRVANGEFKVDFSSCTAAESGPPFTLSSGVSSEIRAVLSENARRQTTLVIIDSGWPDSTEALKSKEFIGGLAQKVRSILGIDVSSPSLGTEFSDPKVGHCRDIKAALEPLANLDPQGIVRVVYMPLTRDQSSSLVLGEVIFLGELIRALENFDLAPPSDTVQAAQKRAEELLKQVPSTPSEEIFSSDKVVLESLLTLLNFVGQKTGEHFFVNESWTVQGKIINFSPRVSGGTFIVASVGNVKGRNINTDGVEFSRRCLTDKDVLAVMNMSSEGSLLCNSSEIDVSNVELLNALGFNGTISPGNSGTSFAAPRVAWFLAAGEALRKTSVDFDAWAARLGKELRELRTTNAGLSKVLFNPISYLRKEMQ